MYAFSSLLFLRAEEKAVWTVCTAKISSESFGPKGRKFLVTKKFALATKSKNLGASWPQGFFSKVEPCKMAECFTSVSEDEFCEKCIVKQLLNSVFA